MLNENVECEIKHENECPYINKPCQEVDHDVCVAIANAYSDGYHVGWMTAFPEESSLSY